VLAINQQVSPLVSGALRALAMAGKSRFDQLPDVSTIDDSVPGYEASAWTGVGVPRNTPGRAS
jgi:tripartite-type tricarboxylate transporter receptor subunit TctC